MTLTELYPYLSDTHDDFVDRLDLLSDDEWNYRYCLPYAISLRQIVARCVARERFLVLEIAQGRKPGSSALETASLSNADLLSELTAARAVSERYVATLAPEMLRSVRAVPADPQLNVPESNMPLSWVLWSVVENEIAAYANALLLLSMSSKASFLAGK